MNNLHQMIESLKKEKVDLMEVNGELRRSLEIAQSRFNDIDAECQRYIVRGGRSYVS